MNSARLAHRTNRKIYLLLGLGIVHIFVTFSTIVPGYLVIDEIFYHWMAKNFSESYSLGIWNGYEEFQSPELVHPTFRIQDGRLVSPWPNMFPILVLPLYRLWGVFGLFVANSVAFLGLVAVCFAAAKRLSHDIDLALNACFILILATFAWNTLKPFGPTASRRFVC